MYCYQGSAVNDNDEWATAEADVTGAVKTFGALL